MSVAPPRPKGPPLNAMRAFEAAARLGSFVAAAEELHVTPGAVSQHVKTLEDWAGVALFHRNAQGVELSSAGRHLVKDFVDAFDAIAAATHALRNLRPQADIHIAALPSVAQLWLPPRLGRIREKFPQLRFSVTALENPPSLSRELFDLSLFFAAPDRTEDHIVLARDEIVPVCTPDMAKRLGAGEQLNTATLLHDQTWIDDWSRWSDLSGIHIDDPASGPRYSLYSLAVEEARSGAGVLMGHLCLIQNAVAAGDLVPIHDRVYWSGRSLVLGLPHPARRRPEIDEVADFLRQRN